MLRPSFKKYFHDDSFSDSSVPLEDDCEPAVEAEPSLLGPEMDDSCDGGKSKIDGKETFMSKLIKKHDPNWDSDRSVYEIQLTQLQEQLVETMLENQQLGNEIEKFKQKGMETLMKELEEEKKKNKRLEEKIKKARPKRPPEPGVKDKRGTPDKGLAEDGHDGWEDLSTVADNTVYPEGVLLASGISSINSLAFAGALPTQKNAKIDAKISAKEHLEKTSTSEPSRIMQWKIRVWNIMHDRLSDFLDDENREVDSVEEGDPLAIKTLRENISRFSDGIRPIRQFIARSEDMVNWTNPWLSLSAFFIYLYSVWIGCFIPLVLLLAISKLSINYLYKKGIAQKFGYHESKKDGDEDSKGEVTSWSERYQLVLQIARKVQNTLGNLANSIEKFESLFTWQHLEASKQLYVTLLALFFASLILPTRLLFLPLGFGLGFKFFVVSPIYKRFPKVKKRYDNVARLWDELPTKEQVCNQRSRSETDAGNNKNPGVNNPTGPDEAHSRSGAKNSVDQRDGPIDAEDDVSWDAMVFCERFQLPQSEVPLNGWQDGRRCTLLNKESPLSNMKHGRLYLTKNFVCFERNQFHSKKNFALRLHDITEVLKSKPFSILPGTGMSIEVSTKTNEKPFLFGAMMGRDEAYESILKAGRSLNLSWGRKS